MNEKLVNCVFVVILEVKRIIESDAGIYVVYLLCN